MHYVLQKDATIPKHALNQHRYSRDRILPLDYVCRHCLQESGTKEWVNLRIPIHAWCMRHYIGVSMALDRACIGKRKFTQCVAASIRAIPTTPHIGLKFHALTLLTKM